MTFSQFLSASAKTLASGQRRNASAYNADGDVIRHAPTGDPRLDLAHADRTYR